MAAVRRLMENARLISPSQFDWFRSLVYNV